MIFKFKTNARISSRTDPCVVRTGSLASLVVAQNVVALCLCVRVTERERVGLFRFFLPYSTQNQIRSACLDSSCEFKYYTRSRTAACAILLEVSW